MEVKQKTTHKGKLIMEYTKLIEALEMIAAGTEDKLPPFRNMPASNMSDIARTALKDFNTKLIMRENGKIMISVTSGMRGIFPVMYDNDGPIKTGFTAKDHEQGEQFAIEWAKAEFDTDWKEHCNFELEEDQPSYEQMIGRSDRQGEVE